MKRPNFQACWKRKWSEVPQLIWPSLIVKMVVSTFSFRFCGWIASNSCLVCVCLNFNFYNYWYSQGLQNSYSNSSLLHSRRWEAELRWIRGRRQHCRIRRTVQALPAIQNVQRSPHSDVRQVRVCRTVSSVSRQEAVRVQNRVRVEWATERPADLPQPPGVGLLQAARLPPLQRPGQGAARDIVNLLPDNTRLFIIGLVKHCSSNHRCVLFICPRKHQGFFVFFTHFVAANVEHYSLYVVLRFTYMKHCDFIVKFLAWWEIVTIVKCRLELKLILT